MTARIKRLDHGERSRLVRNLDACGLSRSDIADELIARGLTPNARAAASIISYALLTGGRRLERRCEHCDGKGWVSP